jgi:sugar lactone lactonase YvrE
MSLWRRLIACGIFTPRPPLLYHGGTSTARGIIVVRLRIRPLFVPALALAAGALCVILPPQWAFAPVPLAGLALAAAGAVAALWPGMRPAWLALVRLAGVALLWGAIAWCVLSQVTAFSQPATSVFAQRTYYVLIAAGIWSFWWLARAWQRRALLAVALPCALALLLLGWPSRTSIGNFRPDYLAVDSHGTLYVADLDGSLIRVFGADGALRAKLWPGLARQMGPPGPGFRPVGPLGDPEHTGLSRATTLTIAGSVFAPRKDPVLFCGLAVDASDRLYVPDPRHATMLRFGADGRLQARWALPPGYQASTGCVAASGEMVYLADQRGTVLALSPEGQVRATWPLPEPIGEIAVTPDGAHLFALAAARIYQLALPGGALTSWTIPLSRGGIVALRSGRVMVGNHAAPQIEAYCADGRRCGTIGQAGELPGQFGDVRGLAVDQDGRLYVSDSAHRVVQVFSPAGHIVALRWAIEDDPQGEGR